MSHGKSPRHRRAARPRRGARSGTGSPGETRPRAERPKPGSRRPAEFQAGGPVRLQKLLAAAGLGSRRGAEHYLEEGRVTVNGRVAKLGDSADPRQDVIEVDGERLAREPLAYWMVHKGAGVVTTVRDPQGRKTVIDLLPPRLPQLHPVGRLDYESTGLVLMTNDGALTHALLHPSLGSEREYRVTVKGELDTRCQRALESGVVLEEGRTAPARVGRVNFDPTSGTTSFALTLVEGRNRQIRRSLLALGRPVKKLVRVRMGPLRLGRLPRNQARALSDDEVAELRVHARELSKQRGRRRSGKPRPRRGSGQRDTRGSSS